MNVGDQFDKSEVRMTSRCSHVTSTSVYCLSCMVDQASLEGGAARRRQA